jgi:hypothetical protein
LPPTAVAESCNKSLSFNPSINSSTLRAASNVSLPLDSGESVLLGSAMTEDDPSNKNALEGSWRMASYIRLYFSIVARSASRALFSATRLAISAVTFSSVAAWGADSLGLVVLLGLVWELRS